ncbi:Amino acid deaminase [Burkholderiales bacterium 8X]|nr:Amino acid deaminase [Burkholderiales bacterium 8X]
MSMPDDDLLDPMLGPLFKGYPPREAPRRTSDIGAAGWNLLAGDLPLPLAVLKADALSHNLAWMQARVSEWGIDLAPHGKTTLSPQIFRRQLDAGAWGLTFASVTQLALGVASGVRRAVVANQVVNEQDLATLAGLLRRHAELRAVFLVDSVAQLDIIESWSIGAERPVVFEVLLELGLDGGRTGCRTQDQALQLAERLHASSAVRLVGIECYEGLWATGDESADKALVDGLMNQLETVARHCEARGWFETDEILLSAGGSAVFDWVAARLRPSLGRPVRGLLRSGCYVTHDHGFYRGMVRKLDARIGCVDCEGLRPALEVWATVQSRPEPHLAILAVGKRDLGFDMGLPTPLHHVRRGTRQLCEVPPSWTITALNDQHAYLRCVKDDDQPMPQVGDLIALGISHPCTTFDKWRWIPLVDEHYTITSAITTNF